MRASRAPSVTATPRPPDSGSRGIPSAFQAGALGLRPFFGSPGASHRTGWRENKEQSKDQNAPPSQAWADSWEEITPAHRRAKKTGHRKPPCRTDHSHRTRARIPSHPKPPAPPPPHPSLLSPVASTPTTQDFSPRRIQVLRTLPSSVPSIENPPHLPASLPRRRRNEQLPRQPPSQSAGKRRKRGMEVPKAPRKGAERRGIDSIP